MTELSLESIVLELERRQLEGGCFRRFFQTEEERSKYPHWIQGFKVGKDYRQRLALCANQTGKTTFGMYEVTCHLTGLYPEWWEGFRFDGPNDWWLGGVTSTEVQGNLQERLLGPVGAFGTGFIPKDCIDFDTLKDAKKSDTSIGTCRIKHKTGGWSTLTFKSYAEGREKWQAKPGISILLDEEPPIDIYTEALMRTIAGEGRVILTFTPLKGVSDTVMNFLGDDPLHPMGEVSTGKYLIRATWDDAPHLSPEAKEALIKSIPPYQRDARTKGIPTLGSGVIYPVSEEIVFIDPFEIPPHWKRAYGMDVGWNRTAAIWGATDPETNTTYAYAEHYLSEENPTIHAYAIKGKGDWIPGAIDPAANGRTQDEGRQLIEMYKDRGLILQNADNAVEGYLFEIYEALLSGKLKIFKTCQNTLKEYRLYRRDEKGRVVRKDNHLMDSLRYLWSTGRSIAKQKPVNTISIGLVPTMRRKF